MHEQSRFLSAPVLSGFALLLAGMTMVAEMVVRNDDQSGIMRAIASDEQQEIERTVETDLSEDFQADLASIVQDTDLAPLTSDKLRSTTLYRVADPMARPQIEAYVGKLLAQRKRHDEALSVLAALSSEQRIEHGSSFAYAQSYRGAGNIQAAIEAYATHVAANPTHNPGYVNYGILLAETDQHEEAIRVFARSAEITSSSRKGKSLSLLGQSQFALNLYEDAIKSFDKSIEYRPDSGPTWRRLATAKAKSQAYPSLEIEADYQRGLALEPDNSRTMAEWGDYYFSLGRFEMALPLLREASDAAANDFDILFSRSVNLLASERPRSARSVIGKMANVEMSTEQALLLRALQEESGIIRPPTEETRDEVCAARTGNERMIYACVLLQLTLEDPVTAAEVAGELAANSVYKHPSEFALARYDYRNGAADLALPRLDALLIENPESPLFWLYKARSIGALDTLALAEDADEVTEADREARAETALIAYEKALEFNPESRKTTLELNAQLLKMERYEQAETLLATYLETKPNDATVLVGLASVHEAAGDLEEAETALLNLMSLSEENDPEIAQQLVGVQMALDKYSDALVTTDNLLEQDPANVAIRELRVVALMELDQFEEAAEERDRIQRLQPSKDADDGAGAEFAAAAP